MNSIGNKASTTSLPCNMIKRQPGTEECQHVLSPGLSVACSQSITVDDCTVQWYCLGCNSSHVTEIKRAHFGIHFNVAGVKFLLSKTQSVHTATSQLSPALATATVVLCTAVDTGRKSGQQLLRDPSGNGITPVASSKLDWEQIFSAKTLTKQPVRVIYSNETPGGALLSQGSMSDPFWIPQKLCPNHTLCFSNLVLQKICIQLAPAVRRSEGLPHPFPTETTSRFLHVVPDRVREDNNTALTLLQLFGCLHSYRHCAAWAATWRNAYQRQNCQNIRAMRRTKERRRVSRGARGEEDSFWSIRRSLWTTQGFSLPHITQRNPKDSCLLLPHSSPSSRISMRAKANDSSSLLLYHWSTSWKGAGRQETKVSLNEEGYGRGATERHCKFNSMLFEPKAVLLRATCLGFHPTNAK